jgi:hypothetical protein
VRAAQSARCCAPFAAEVMSRIHAPLRESPLVNAKGALAGREARRGVKILCVVLSMNRAAYGGGLRFYCPAFDEKPR